MLISALGYLQGFLVAYACRSKLLALFLPAAPADDAYAGPLERAM